jgi:hypothetical protein
MKSLLRSAIYSALLALCAIGLPDVVKVSSGDQETVNVLDKESRCLPVNLWRYSDLQVSVKVTAVSRSTDYSVLWTTKVPHTNGLAMTTDLYGNVFLSVQSHAWEDQTPRVFLVSEPFDLETDHDFTFRFTNGGLVEASFDNQAIQIKSVDGIVTEKDQSLNTSVNQVCVGQKTGKPFPGTVSLKIVGRANERELQITWLRVFLLVLSLGLLLRCVERYATEKDGDKKEDVE